MPSRRTYGQLVGLFMLALAFIAVSYLVHRYQVDIASAVRGGGVFGILGFVLLTAVFVVFVIPLDIVFLIPVGAAVYGPIPTALMSITGWTIGAAVAFGIARLWGQPVVERLIGLKRVHAVESRIPKQNFFWSVVVLRMIVSVDILSYALGLASEMRWGSYVLATLIGVVPVGFFLAYTGALPFWYRMLAVLGVVLFATIMLLRYGVAREP